MIVGEAIAKALVAEGVTLAAGISGTHIAQWQKLADEVEIVEFLVLKHLTMAHLAFRRDVGDETLLASFAGEVGSPEVLRMLALLTAVLFINENDITPARSIGQMVGASLVGILTAVVLHEFSTAWPMLGIALVSTGALVRGLGLLKGLGLGYMSCWAVELMTKIGRAHV